MKHLSIEILVAYAACILHVAVGSSTANLRAERSLASDKAILGPPGSSCPSGYDKVSTVKDCKKIGKQNSASLGWKRTEKKSSWPAGCYHCDNVSDCSDGTKFNKHPTGQARAGVRLWCLPSDSDPQPVPAPVAAPVSAPSPGPPTISGKILFAGDSDIELWNTQSSFPGSKNVGVGGWTCKNVLKKIDKFLQQHSPEWVVLVCGENDLAEDTSVNDTFQRFEEIVSKINAFGARVVYMGTKPEPSTKSLHALYRQYDAKIRALASASADRINTNEPLLTWVDVYKSFEALGNGNNLYQRDKLHLSQRGYELWTNWAKQAMNDSNGCFEWKSEECVDSIA